MEHLAAADFRLLVAAHCGAHFAATHALGFGAAFARFQHVDQVAVDGLVYFRGPQGAVQVDPVIAVNVQETARTVAGQVVADKVAEDTDTVVA